MSRLLLCLPVLLAAGCLSIPSSKEAGVSYATVPSSWPADVVCLNGETPGVAKEVLIGATRTVVVAGGPRPISDDAWAAYTPSFGNQKNADRRLLFGASCFSRSPDQPFDCEGAACRTVVELDGHTWIALSAVESLDCVPAGRCAPTSLAPGSLAVVVTRKCHELRFSGEAFFLRGPAGEVAVMHATEDGVPDTDVELPPGWSLTREALAEELVLRPFGGGDACYYNIVRDSRVQAYHQIGYAGATYPSE